MAEGRKKAEQILQLEPANELVFTGPFKDVVATTLTLTNPIAKPVAFKVKTTAPRHYCVKPNCGTVPPNESVNVGVMLQPFDHSSSDNKRHKFMVQTIVVPDGQQDIESLWKSGGASAMMDSKLKCVFQMPTESQSPKEDVTPTPSDQGTVTNQASSQLPAPVFASPAAKTPTPSLAAVSALDTTQKLSGNEIHAKESSQETNSTTALSQSLAASQKQLEEQLESLRAENMRLKKQISDLKEDGTRLRSVKNSSPSNAPTAAGVNMSQELNASQITPILAAIIALLIGCLIGKFIL